MSSTELDTRSRILEKTWRLMEEHRGQGVRIEDIARAAGVSRQAVYLHFPSRADLLVAATHYLDSVLGENARYQTFCEAQTGVEKLEAYVDFWGNYIPDIYGLAKALIVAQETDADAASAWEARMDDVRDGCLGVIKLLESEQALAPDWTVDEATDMMLTMLLVPNWEYLTTQCSWTQDLYVSRMKKALKKMFVK